MSSSGSISSGLDSIGNGISNFGAAAGDLLAAQGSREAAKAYTTASGIATSNAELTRRSTDIQQEQEQRTIIQAIGTETADVAGAGFKNSGSAFYLMKSSLEQGSLAKSLIENQGEITTQGYEQQASAYTGQAKAAEAAAAGQQAGAATKSAGGVLDFVSGVLKIFGL